MEKKPRLKSTKAETTSPQPIEIEEHPWPPFIPAGAKILIMGTFPPGNHRWSMDFYYPNRTNDFWRICGLIFLGDKNALYDAETGTFDRQAIERLMTEKRIALNDTARKVRRLKGNASDKFLEIVEPVPLESLLAEMPDCFAVATTGEKAAGVVAALTGTEVPATGGMVETFYAPLQRNIHIWRMPSSSRAYPLAVEKKAMMYEAMFKAENIL